MLTLVDERRSINPEGGAGGEQLCSLLLQRYVLRMVTSALEKLRTGEIKVL